MPPELLIHFGMIFRNELLKHETAGRKKELFVVDVACGENHSVVMTLDGTVFGWGCNVDGQLCKFFKKTFTNMQQQQKTQA